MREPEGTWSLDVNPSMGQDEFGGEDGRNYLCSLFAARYTFRAAVDLAQRLRLTDPDLDRWRAILATA